jgi:predicted dehydrogenase
LSLRVGIIGAGLIGGKRADAITALGDHVIAFADKNEARAKELAKKYSADAIGKWEELIKRSDIDAVVIATSNDAIPLCTLGALESGKHVFVEKPAGRFPEELRLVVERARHSKGKLSVGFNHRFHPGLFKAHQMVQEGAIGEVMYLRARYGHGGRIGYDKEWRAVPEIAGGGELLDQGVHLIDLCRWFAGEFDLEVGRVHTFFWDMPVEDNGFLLLRSRDTRKFAHLHASCTEWKNLFDFEIFGKGGKLQVLGLGRSYGVEELRYFKMKPEMGPPDIQTWTFPGEDLSWQDEWKAFRETLLGKQTALGTIEDALRAVEIVHAAYTQSKMSYAKS